MISAEIDIGMWSDTYISEPISDEILNNSMIDNAEIKFQYNEANYLQFLDLDFLKQYY